MEIIRKLDDNGDLIKPLNHDERIIVWNHCYKHVRRPDGMTYYKLVELGMLGSYESTTCSDSDISSGSDSFFPICFLK